MKKESKPAAGDDTPNTTPDCHLGANGCAVLKVGSQQWEAWLRYHQSTGDRGRANLMLTMAERSRWGEWQEPTEWPPSHSGASSENLSRQAGT